jgi:hypothetical protein
MVHLVCFHLSAENAPFEEALKVMGSWSNRLPGAWVLETALSARQVRDRLGPHMKPEDRLFVARISRAWAARNLGKGFPEWMGRRNTLDPAPANPVRVAPRKVPEA